MGVLEILQKYYPIMLWISVAVQILCIMILTVNRATEAQKYIVATLNESLIYTIGCLIHYLGYTPQAISIGMKIQLTSTFFLTLLLYITFRLVYNENNSKPFYIFIVLIAVVLNIPVLGTRESGVGVFGWLSNNYEIVNVGNSKFLETGVSPFRSIYYSFIILFIVLQLIVFIKSVSIAYRHKYKIRYSFFLTAFISQIIIACDLMFGWYKLGLPFAPVLGIVASSCCCILIGRKKVTNLYDISREEVINSLKDPLFIIDNRFYVRYANNVAKVLFPEYKTLKSNSYRRLKACPELQNIITPPIHETLVDEGFLKIGKQIYEPELHRMGKSNNLLGYVITLNDVTEQETKNDFLEKQNAKLSSALRTIKNRNISERDKLISGIVQFVMDRDSETAAHMKRTSNYTFVIARELRRMGYYTDVLTDSYMETLGQVAPMHDVGKFMIPLELLGKTDLTEEEKKSVQSHAVLGAQMVDRLIVNNPDDLFYRLSHEVALSHHEWWNGTGYPKNLIEEEIPLSARIVAVADFFDTLSVQQHAKKTYNFDEAFDSIDRYSSTRFDPTVVEAFKNAKEKLKELYDQMFL